MLQRLTNNFRHVFLYACLLISFQSIASNDANLPNNDIDRQLEHADSIRSSEPENFKNILNLLTRQKNSLSIEQLNHLNYLTAYRLTYSGQFKEAIAKFKDIINSNASTLLKFRANLSTVNIHAISHNWTDGLKHLSINFEMLDKISDEKFKQQGLIVAAILYNLLGQYELGLNYAEKLLSETKNQRNICLANHLLLESKLYLKHINANSNEISVGIQSCENANEHIMASLIRSYLAIMLINNEQAPQATELLYKTLNIVENTKYSPLIVKYYSLLAKSYFLENNFIEAKKYAHKTLTLSNGLEDTKPLIRASSILYKISLQKEKFSEALTYYIKYSEANTAHLEDEKAKHLAFQLAEHKELEQKNQITLLNKKNALLTAEQALTKANEENTRLIIMVLVLTLLVLTFWGYRLLKSHKRIKELAEYDALTGIFNRGHFTQVANNALRYCESAEQELSLIMFDLDHFKKINDTYGHACGDWALKTAVDACKSIGRQNDIFARFGGEEFCILLTSCDKQTAKERAEACRQAIEEINTADSGFDFTITASFGVTDVKTSGFELEKILADADSAAYSAKEAGRNQVRLFHVESMEEAPTKLDDSLNAF